MSANLENANGPQRYLGGTRVVDISTVDYNPGFLFFAVVNSSGTGQVVVYRDKEATEDQTNTLNQGQHIGALRSGDGTILVALRTIKNAADSDTTATSIIVGLP